MDYSRINVVLFSSNTFIRLRVIWGIYWRSRLMWVLPRSYSMSPWLSLATFEKPIMICRPAVSWGFYSVRVYVILGKFCRSCLFYKGYSLAFVVRVNRLHPSPSVIKLWLVPREAVGLFPRDPQHCGRGERKLTVSRGPVFKCFVISLNSKIEEKTTKKSFA